MPEFNDLPTLNDPDDADIIPCVDVSDQRRLKQLPLSQVRGLGPVAGTAPILFQERTSSGISAGGLSEESWFIRDINFHDGDIGKITTGGRFLLPPGHYSVTGYASTLEAHQTKARLTSNDLSINIPGLSLWALHYTAASLIQGIFTIEQETIFKLESIARFQVNQLPNSQQQSWNPSAHWRRGYASNFGTPEIYSSLLFYRH